MVTERCRDKPTILTCGGSNKVYNRSRPGIKVVVGTGKSKFWVTIIWWGLITQLVVKQGSPSAMVKLTTKSRFPG